MNKFVPIFDSLTHPMPDGNWIHKKYDGRNTLPHLHDSMKEQGINWAIACGMGSNIGSYSEENYAEFVIKNNTSEAVTLYPIAFIEVEKIRLLDKVELFEYLRGLIKLGYIGVKLHPRFAKFNFEDRFLSEFIIECSKLGLGVFLCTYIWGKGCCNQSTPEALMRLTEKLSKHNANVILVHGGGVRLLEYVEIARAFDNVLLDLSLTICKYEGSSIDMDLRFCFEKFDRRICIGSDGPEYSSRDLRERFEYLSNNLTIEKKQNIAFKNIYNFLPLINKDTSYE